MLKKTLSLSLLFSSAGRGYNKMFVQGKEQQEEEAEKGQWSFNEYAISYYSFPSPHLFYSQSHITFYFIFFRDHKKNKDFLAPHRMRKINT